MTDKMTADLDAADAAALERALRARRPSDSEIAATVRERVRPAYALVRLLPGNALLQFIELGDRLDGKFSAEALAALIERGEASHDNPKEA